MRNLIITIFLAMLTYSHAEARDLDAKLIWKAKQICGKLEYQKEHENYAECVRYEYDLLTRKPRGDPYDRQSEAWLTADRTHDGHSRRSLHDQDLIREARYYCQDHPRYLRRKCITEELRLLRDEQSEDPYDRNSAAWLTHEPPKPSPYRDHSHEYDEDSFDY